MGGASVVFGRQYNKLFGKLVTWYTDANYFYRWAMIQASLYGG